MLFSGKTSRPCCKAAGKGVYFPPDRKIATRNYEVLTMKLIADEKIIFESPDPAGIYCYTPAILVGENRRLIAAVDLGGPGTTALEGPRSLAGDYPSGNQIRILLSDDGGVSWRESASRLPMMHETLFRTSSGLWMLGHSGALMISRSTDNGESWSEPVVLEKEHLHHQSCGRVDVHNGRVYAVYEQRLENHCWPDVAPVLMSAPEDADLSRPENWTFSKRFDPYPALAMAAGAGLCASRFASVYEVPGILETSVVRMHNPASCFYDPSGRSVLLLMRAYTGYENVAAALRGVEAEDGSLKIERYLLPDGRIPFLIPFPGGNMKFHLDYDPVSQLYWLVASQADGIHCNRRRLRLLYSPDCLNWTEAGMVAVGPSENGARHYATLAFFGEDLVILSRSGDQRAKNAHDNNLITFHKVRNFRSLVD